MWSIVVPRGFSAAPTLGVRPTAALAGRHIYSPAPFAPSSTQPVRRPSITAAGSFPSLPFSREGASPQEAAQEFFLFIKDYGWSLRYTVSKVAESVLDTNNPLKLEWVKLKRPLSNPAELLQVSSHDLFEWETTEPPRHKGFMYHVTRAIGSGVEAVINFFEGHGLNLLVHADGIQLLKQDAGKDAEADNTTAKAVTHCWVQVMGMPFLPMLQSIAFYNLQEVVLDWQA